MFDDSVVAEQSRMNDSLSLEVELLETLWSMRDAAAMRPRAFARLPGACCGAGSPREDPTLVDGRSASQTAFRLRYF